MLTGSMGLGTSSEDAAAAEEEGEDRLWFDEFDTRAQGEEQQVAQPILFFCFLGLM